MNLNLELRSQILEYSLNIEKEINNLLLLFLKIYTDEKNTRLFGYRPGITFKNKIDLLFDLQILSKEENYHFELLMIFRNKFLHDIDCNSFNLVFEQLDNGIVNKFKKFLDEGSDIKNEESCLTAFRKLYLKNIRVLLRKIEDKKKQIALNADLFHNFREQSEFQVDIFFNLIDNIYSEFEEADLKNSKIQELVKNISSICEKSSEQYSNDENLRTLRKKQKELLQNSDIYKEYWDIVKSDRIKRNLQ